MRIVISSAHALHVPGARGLIDENTESRRVVAEAVRQLEALDVAVVALHDNQSHSQAANINWLVDQHNTRVRDLDVSVHFNAFRPTPGARGTETLYLTAQAVAARVSKAIADASGLRDRGAKKRTDLGFLNRTNRPAILIEVCFVDSQLDVRLYRESFQPICAAIANALSPEAVS